MPVTCKVKNCDNRAVLKRPKTGDPMCKECFFYSFETEIHFTIVKGELFKRGNRVAVGASGGKDSTVLAYIMKLLNERYDYGLDLFLLSIDEGISGYRDDSLETVKQNKEDYQLPLKILSYKDLYGWTMDEIVAQIGKSNNCTFCGVFRRQALDRGAALVGADIIATGHNADDVAETVIMNMMRGDLARLSRCTNIITEGEGSIPRCKPLMYAYEKEIVMYAHFKELVYFSTECIYAPNAYRGYTREYIKDVERIRPSCILDIIHSGETIRLKDTIKLPARRTCTRCGFVASQEICKACVLLEGLNRGIPKLGVGKSNKAKKLLGIHVPDGSENRSKKPLREGKSKKKIKRELQKEKQMKLIFQGCNSSGMKESTCTEDCSEESNAKLTGKEDRSSETKSTCGNACSPSCRSKMFKPSEAQGDESLAPDADVKFDVEQVMRFIENSLGIKDGESDSEECSTENNEKTTCTEDCFTKHNKTSISKKDVSSGSNEKSISEADKTAENNKKSIFDENQFSQSNKRSTCGQSCTSSCNSKISTTSGPKKDELFLLSPNIDHDEEEAGCLAFDSELPLMSMEAYSSSEDEEIHNIGVKEKEKEKEDLRAESPPDSFVIDLEEYSDVGFDIAGFLSLISNHTQEEIQEARIKQVFGFDPDEDLEKFFSCDHVNEEPEIKSTEANETDKLSTVEKTLEYLQLNVVSDFNSTKSSQSCSSTANESEKPESISFSSTLKDPEKAETDEQPTIVKANPKKKGPSLILPHMMHKTKNNLDF